MQSPHLYFRYSCSLTVTIISFLLICQSLMAQSAISPAGGIISSSAGSITFTAGEPFLLNSTGNSGKLTGGIQQPYSLYTLGTPPEVPKDNSLSLLRSPDGEHLVLVSAGKSGYLLTYNLTDISGRNFQSGEITEKETSFSLGSFPPGMYLLTILRGNRHLTTFRIVKNQ